MDRPSNVPDTAVPIPSSAATPFPAVQVQTVATITSYVEMGAKNDVTAFFAKCENWRINALHCRDLGIALPPKPEVPHIASVQTFHDEATDTVWVWTVTAPADLPPCPDLPPVVKTPAGTANIGNNIYGAWYECRPDDTIGRNEYVTVTAGSVFASGVIVPPGKYQKIGGPMPGMNWYIKTA